MYRRTPEDGRDRQLSQGGDPYVGSHLTPQTPSENIPTSKIQPISTPNVHSKTSVLRQYRKSDCSADGVLKTAQNTVHYAPLKAEEFCADYSKIVPHPTVTHYPPQGSENNVVDQQTGDYQMFGTAGVPRTYYQDVNKMGFYENYARVSPVLNQNTKDFSQKVVNSYWGAQVAPPLAHSGGQVGENYIDQKLVYNQVKQQYSYCNQVKKSPVENGYYMPKSNCDNSPNYQTPVDRRISPQGYPNKAEYPNMYMEKPCDRLLPDQSYQKPSMDARYYLQQNNYVPQKAVDPKYRPNIPKKPPYPILENRLTNQTQGYTELGDFMYPKYGQIVPSRVSPTARVPSQNYLPPGQGREMAQNYEQKKFTNWVVPREYRDNAYLTQVAQLDSSLAQGIVNTPIKGYEMPKDPLMLDGMRYPFQNKKLYYPEVQNVKPNRPQGNFMQEAPRIMDNYAMKNLEEYSRKVPPDYQKACQNYRQDMARENIYREEMFPGLQYHRNSYPVVRQGVKPPENPPRNISPRSTFQENMPTIVIPPQSLQNFPDNYYNQGYLNYNQVYNKSVPQYPVEYQQRAQNVPRMYQPPRMQYDSFPAQPKMDEAYRYNRQEVYYDQTDRRNAVDEGLKNGYKGKESEISKLNLKEFLENWEDDEEIVSNLPDLVLCNNLPERNASLDSAYGISDNSNDKASYEEDGKGILPDQTLYILEKQNISPEMVSKYQHLTQFDRLPDNIKGYYRPTDDSKKNGEKDASSDQALNLSVSKLEDPKNKPNHTEENNNLYKSDKLAADSKNPSDNYKSVIVSNIRFDNERVSEESDKETFHLATNPILPDLAIALDTNDENLDMLSEYVNSNTSIDFPKIEEDNVPKRAEKQATGSGEEETKGKEQNIEEETVATEKNISRTEEIPLEEDSKEDPDKEDHRNAQHSTDTESANIESKKNTRSSSPEHPTEDKISKEDDTNESEEEEEQSNDRTKENIEETDVTNSDTETSLSSVQSNEEDEPKMDDIDPVCENVESEGSEEEAKEEVQENSEVLFNPENEPSFPVNDGGGQEEEESEKEESEELAKESEEESRVKENIYSSLGTGDCVGHDDNGPKIIDGESKEDEKEGVKEEEDHTNKSREENIKSDKENSENEYAHLSSFTDHSDTDTIYISEEDTIPIVSQDCQEQDKQEDSKDDIEKQISNEFNCSDFEYDYDSCSSESSIYKENHAKANSDEEECKETKDQENTLEDYSESSEKNYFDANVSKVEILETRNKEVDNEAKEMSKEEEIEADAEELDKVEEVADVDKLKESSCESVILEDNEEQEPTNEEDTIEEQLCEATAENNAIFLDFSEKNEEQDIKLNSIENQEQGSQTKTQRRKKTHKVEKRPKRYREKRKIVTLQKKHLMKLRFKERLLKYKERREKMMSKKLVKDEVIRIDDEDIQDVVNPENPSENDEDIPPTTNNNETGESEKYLDFGIIKEEEEDTDDDRGDREIEDNAIKSDEVISKDNTMDSLMNYEEEADIGEDIIDLENNIFTLIGNNTRNIPKIPPNQIDEKKNYEEQNPHNFLTYLTDGLDLKLPHRKSSISETITTNEKEENEQSKEIKCLTDGIKVIIPRRKSDQMKQSLVEAMQETGNDDDKFNLVQGQHRIAPKMKEDKLDNADSDKEVCATDSIPVIISKKCAHENFEHSKIEELLNKNLLENAIDNDPDAEVSMSDRLSKISHKRTIKTMVEVSKSLENIEDSRVQKYASGNIFSEEIQMKEEEIENGNEECLTDRSPVHLTKIRILDNLKESATQKGNKEKLKETEEKSLTDELPVIIPKKRTKEDPQITRINENILKTLHIIQSMPQSCITDDIPVLINIKRGNDRLCERMKQEVIPIEEISKNLLEAMKESEQAKKTQNAEGVKHNEQLDNAEGIKEEFNISDTLSEEIKNEEKSFTIFDENTYERNQDVAQRPSNEELYKQNSEKCKQHKINGGFEESEVQLLERNSPSLERDEIVENDDLCDSKTDEISIEKGGEYKQDSEECEANEENDDFEEIVDQILETNLTGLERNTMVDNDDFCASIVGEITIEKEGICKEYKQNAEECKANEENGDFEEITDLLLEKSLGRYEMVEDDAFCDAIIEGIPIEKEGICKENKRNSEECKANEENADIDEIADLLLEKDSMVENDDFCDAIGKGIPIGKEDICKDYKQNTEECKLSDENGDFEEIADLLLENKLTSFERNAMVENDDFCDSIVEELTIEKEELCKKYKQNSEQCKANQENDDFQEITDLFLEKKSFERYEIVKKDDFRDAIIEEISKEYKQNSEECKLNKENGDLEENKDQCLETDSPSLEKVEMVDNDELRDSNSEEISTEKEETFEENCTQIQANKLVAKEEVSSNLETNKNAVENTQRILEERSLAQKEDTSNTELKNVVKRPENTNQLLGNSDENIAFITNSNEDFFIEEEVPPDMIEISIEESEIVEEENSSYDRLFENEETVSNTGLIFDEKCTNNNISSYSSDISSKFSDSASLQHLLEFFPEKNDPISAKIKESFSKIFDIKEICKEKPTNKIRKINLQDYRKRKLSKSLDSAKIREENIETVFEKVVNQPKIEERNEKVDDETKKAQKKEIQHPRKIVDPTCFVRIVQNAQLNKISVIKKNEELKDKFNKDEKDKNDRKTKTEVKEKFTTENIEKKPKDKPEPKRDHKHLESQKSKLETPKPKRKSSIKDPKKIAILETLSAEKTLFVNPAILKRSHSKEDNEERKPKTEAKHPKLELEKVKRRISEAGLKDEPREGKRRHSETGEKEERREKKKDRRKHPEKIEPKIIKLSDLYKPKKKDESDQKEDEKKNPPPKDPTNRPDLPKTVDSPQTKEVFQVKKSKKRKRRFRNLYTISDSEEDCPAKKPKRGGEPPREDGVKVKISLESLAPKCDLKFSLQRGKAPKADPHKHVVPKMIIKKSGTTYSTVLRDARVAMWQPKVVLERYPSSELENILNNA